MTLDRNRPAFLPRIRRSLGWLAWTASIASCTTDPQVGEAGSSGATTTATTTSAVASGTQGGSDSSADTDGVTASSATESTTTDSGGVASTSGGDADTGTTTTTTTGQDSTSGEGRPGSINCGEEQCGLEGDPYCVVCGDLGEETAQCNFEPFCVGGGEGSYALCDGNEDCTEPDVCVAVNGSLPFLGCWEDGPELGCNPFALRTCTNNGDCPACAPTCVLASEADESFLFDAFDAIDVMLCTSL